MGQNKEYTFEYAGIIDDFEASYVYIAPNVVACCLSHEGAKVSVTGLASCLDPDRYNDKDAKGHAYKDAAGKVHQFERYRESMNSYLASRVPKAPEPRDIGYMVRAIKNGSVAARKSWAAVGQYQYVYYVPPAKYPATRNGNETLAGHAVDDMIQYTGYLAMRHKDGSVSPWGPSGNDAIAEDWYAWELTAPKTPTTK